MWVKLWFIFDAEVGNENVSKIMVRIWCWTECSKYYCPYNQVFHDCCQSGPLIKNKKKLLYQW